MARYALVVGISEYTGSFNSLPAPVRDANAIADLLDRHGNFDQVKRLPFRREAGQKDLGRVIPKPLTCLEFTSELQQFFADANGSDVLFYYSGHGFTLTSPASGVREGFLAPSDCQVELKRVVNNGQVMTSPGKEIESQKNGISFYDLNALISRYHFSSLTMILDCCNSGALLESDMVRRDAREFGFQRDYYLITACRSASKAYQGEEYSLLTGAVLKGLSQENASPQSGRVSGDRLFDVIGGELQNSRQEPIRMGWGRLITLVCYDQPQPTPETGVSFNPANPYMGLQAFEPDQAKYFFGRESAVRALLDRLAENRFVAVIGPSGCGKSSLVQAGLFPELERDRLPGSQTWQPIRITPGQYPLSALTNTLQQHATAHQSLLLFVDQFEELFTLGSSEADQRQFIHRLNDETTNPHAQTRVIIAMRGDFLDRCAKFQESADLINNTAPTTYMVTPLTEARLVSELRDAIIKPADRHGVQFEAGLVDRIVNDVVNQPGAMPLLQYALLQLWDTCISPTGSRLLTHQGYEAIDGVKGALQRRANDFYGNLSTPDQTFVRELISELVQLGDNGEVTRRRATWERLRAIATSPEQLDRIIGQLVYQRLLVTDDNTVEVAHEALLSESQLIQFWIDESRDSIRLQQRLEIYRREWEEHNQSEDYLLDAGRLAAVEEWLEKKQPRLMPIDQEFIAGSKERRDRQFQAQLEQERQLREEAEGRAKSESQKTKMAISLGSLLVVLTTLTGLFAWWANVERSNAQVKEVKALIAQAEAIYRTDDQLKALVATVAALKQLKSGENQVPIELQKIVYSIKESNRLEGHTREVSDASFSPNGEMIVSGSFDGKIKLWSNEGRLLASFGNSEKAVSGVTFSSNSKTIASVGLGETINIWNTNGKLIREINPKSLVENSGILMVRFSPDNKTIAVANWRNNATVWRIADGKPSRTFQHKAAVYDVSFSPDGTMLASSSWDKTVKLWSLSKGKLIRNFQHDDRTNAVSFSPDGTILASGSWDKTIKLWNVSNGKLLRVIKDDSKIFGLSFSSDSKTIASASEGKVVKLWAVRNGKLLKSFEGHSNDVNSVGFSPDSRYIISASDDQTVRIWSASLNIEQNNDINTAIVNSCNWLSSFLQNNSNLTSEERRLCQGI